VVSHIVVVAEKQSSPSVPSLVLKILNLGWFHSTIVNLEAFILLLKRVLGAGHSVYSETFLLQVVTKRPPPSHVEVENYGFKMFIFVMFILALIMIPIAIVWETRKTYIKSTDAYKGLAKWVFRSFGYKI